MSDNPQTTKRIIDLLKEIAPFELVQGDAIHRLNPSSGQVVNSNQCWLVGFPHRSAHKLKKLMDELNGLIHGASNE